MRLSRLVPTILLVAGCLLGPALDAAAPGYEPRVFDSAKGPALNYRLHVPAELDPEEAYPLILFLHGAGERGDDNELQLLHGAWDILDFTIENDVPAFILAPQCPAEAKWVDIPWNRLLERMPEAPSAPMRLVIELMDALIAEYPIDEGRIYVTGLSMGGYGTWDIVQRVPGRFAAALPICGGGDPAQAARIRHVPIWAFHGSNDTIVPLRQTLDMIDALEAAGGSPSYTVYGGVGHDAWSRTYSNEDVLWWLFDQELPLDEDE